MVAARIRVVHEIPMANKEKRRSTIEYQKKSTTSLNNVEYSKLRSNSENSNQTSGNSDRTSNNVEYSKLRSNSGNSDRTSGFGSNFNLTEESNLSSVLVATNSIQTQVSSSNPNLNFPLAQSKLPGLLEKRSSERNIELRPKLGLISRLSQSIISVVFKSSVKASQSKMELPSVNSVGMVNSPSDLSEKWTQTLVV